MARQLQVHVIKKNNIESNGATLASVEEMQPNDIRRPLGVYTFFCVWGEVTLTPLLLIMQCFV